MKEINVHTSRQVVELQQVRDQPHIKLQKPNVHRNTCN